MAHDHGVEDRLLVEGELVLAQHGDALAGADGDLPLVRFHLAGQDLQKGRFAGAVGADQAVAVAGGELDIDVFEDDPLAVSEGHVVGADHDLLLSVGAKQKPQGDPCGPREGVLIPLIDRRWQPVSVDNSQIWLFSGSGEFLAGDSGGGRS